MTDLFRLDRRVAVVTGACGKLGPVWVEALLDHPSETTPGDLPVSCRIVNAKKATFADTGMQSLPVDPGARWMLFRRRLTVLARKKWLPGRYTLSCAAGPVTFVTIGFDLTR